MTNNAYDGDDDDGFTLYQATANDPGWPLMVVTLGYCLFVYFVAWLWVMKKRRVDRANASQILSTSTASASSSSQWLKNANPTRKDIKDVESLSAVIALSNKDHEKPQQGGNKTTRVSKPAEVIVTPTIRREMTSNRKNREQNRFLRRLKASAADDDESVLTFGSFFGGGRNKARKQNQSVDCNKKPRDVAADCNENCEDREDEVARRKATYGRSESDYHPMEEIDDVEEMMFLDEPMTEIHRISGPWIFASIINEFSDIATVSLIALYIGNDSMITYITVEFILSMLQLISYGVHEACYKLSNLAISSDDEDRAGRIAQVSAYLSLLACAPAFLVSIFWMEDILLFFGHGRYMRSIGASYAILSSLMSLFDAYSSMYSALVDLNDGAHFNAVFDFYDSIVGLSLTFAAVVLLDMTLIDLGVIWLAYHVIVTVFYFMRIRRKGFLEPYFDGDTEPFHLLRSKKALKLASSICHAALPLTAIGIVSDLEYRFISIMTKHIGSAEAATWILLMHVWSFIECWFESFASASGKEVNALLIRGDIIAAQRTSRKARAFAFFYGALISLAVFVTSHPIARLLTSDYTLQSMLAEGIEFACICVPFTAIGSISEEINKEQGRYRSSMAISWGCSFLLTLPLSAFMNYGLNFGIPGVVTGVVVGSTTDGMLQTVLLVYSNFEAASSTLQDHASDDLTTVV